MSKKIIWKDIFVDLGREMTLGMMMTKTAVKEVYTGMACKT